MAPETEPELTMEDAQKVKAWIRMSKRYEQEQARTSAFLDEKFVVLLTAMSGGCALAVIDHKLHSGDPVFFFTSAAIIFAVSVMVLLGRIALRPYVYALAEEPESDLPKERAHQKRYKKDAEVSDKNIAKIFLICVSLGMFSAVLGTYGEAKCYDLPESAACANVFPAGTRLPGSQ
jgi:hypothetical protein